MDQRGGVDHLHHRAQPGADRALVAAHLRPQQQDGGAHPLAAAVAHVLADVVDQGDRGTGLAHQFLLDLGHSVFDQPVDFVRSQGAPGPVYLSKAPLGTSAAKVARTGFPSAVAATTMPSDSTPMSLAGFRFATITIFLFTRLSGS